MRQLNRALVEALEERVRNLTYEDVMTDLVEYMYEWADKNLTEEQIDNFIETGEW
jgi:hypothetical protein